MPNTNSPRSEWERVAAELRAYREAQEQSWGGLDEVIVAKYLAGTCSPEEKDTVEKVAAEKPAVAELLGLAREVIDSTTAGLTVADSSNREMRPSLATRLPTQAQPNRWLLFSGIAASLIILVGIGYVNFNRRPPSDPLKDILFNNLAATDRKMLMSADELTVVGIALSCDDPEIRKLGDQYRNDPKTLLKIVRKELEK